MGKFDNVPIDDDTTVIFRQEVKFGRHDILYEKWSWDGFIGESLIFQDAELASFDDKAVIGMIRESPLVNPESDITIRRGCSGFTLANFNFKTYDLFD